MFFSFTDMLDHFKSTSLINNYNYNSHIITYNLELKIRILNFVLGYNENIGCIRVQTAVY